jgi:predicted nucleic acid-binding protein
MNTLIAVDANILMSALLGGRPHQLLFHPQFNFITTERTTWEVKRYIPSLAQKLELPELEVLLAFESLPITAYQERDYEAQLPRARDLIAARDPKDVDILALALATGVPLWSQDNDFENIDEIVWLTTEKMVEWIAPASVV